MLTHSTTRTLNGVRLLGRLHAREVNLMFGGSTVSKVERVVKGIGMSIMSMSMSMSIMSMSMSTLQLEAARAKLSLPHFSPPDWRISLT